jgi:ProP effector
MTKAPQRFDLDGQPAGEISEEHRQVASEELARRRANHQAKIDEADAARRRRAALLRDFDNTTLTPANFCALKGIAPEALDALLATARREAQEWRDRPRDGPRDRPRERPPMREPRRPRPPEGAKGSNG